MKDRPMRSLIAAIALALLSTVSHAADNTIVLTPGSGVTERSKDIGGGVQSVVIIPGDTAGTPLATAPGSGNTSFALPIQGVASGIAVPVSGTFWQTTQPVSIASGQISSGAISSGAVASGAFASGAIASGAYASGSIGSGAIVSGGDVTEGTTAETTVYAGSGGCTVVACLKGLYAGITGSIPSGTNPIGTVNPTTAANWAIGATGSAVPANAQYMGVNTGGNSAGIHVCGTRAFVTFTASADISIVPGVSAQNVYVCDYSISFSGAGSVYLESTTTTGTAKGSGCSATLAAVEMTWTGVVGGGEKGTKAIYTGLNTGAGNGLCINSGSGATGSVSVWFDQY